MSRPTIPAAAEPVAHPLSPPRLPTDTGPTIPAPAPVRNLSRRRAAQQAAMRAAMTEPIPCQCGRCGGEAVIIPTPDGKGFCVCRSRCCAETIRRASR